ncbi:hypothetical protein OS493_040146 [Desmophyllum pertusum]|uniref:Uncharacterized protein n=1 Tax=Desmophyllum pertusum TaxID=174260 RepID=A0A9X0CMZ0_9CNID|nr:hypothetical protein OS493_040146 [Desmophyllum pertusum]
MSRGSIPVYTDASYMTPMGNFTERTRSMGGQVNPGLSLKEEYVTMNPLYEGQVVSHKDLDQLNCSEFGLSPIKLFIDTREDPEEFNETYDCPGEILNSQALWRSPIPM